MAKKYKRKKVDIKQQVVDQLIAKIEEGGAGAWKKSWASFGGGLPLRHTGEFYRGINIFILSLQGRSNPNWMTFNQMAGVLGWERNEKGKWPWVEGEGVIKDEKGTQIVFFGFADKKDADGEKDGKYAFQRVYSVFNAEQIEGLPASYYPSIEDKHTEPRLEEADAYIKATGAEIRYGGDRAFFSPSGDFLQIPEFRQFFSAEEYYGTKLHELVHWTGHESRLDRFYKSEDGTKDYAFEELVAESGAAILSATLNISTEVRKDHVQYMASWLKRLKEPDGGDALFKAAAAAQKAVDLLDGLQQPLEIKEAA